MMWQDKTLKQRVGYTLEYINKRIAENSDLDVGERRRGYHDGCELARVMLERILDGDGEGGA